MKPIFKDCYVQVSKTLRMLFYTHISINNFTRNNWCVMQDLSFSDFSYSWKSCIVHNSPEFCFLSKICPINLHDCVFTIVPLILKEWVAYKKICIGYVHWNILHIKTFLWKTVNYYLLNIGNGKKWCDDTAYNKALNL